MTARGEGSNPVLTEITGCRLSPNTLKEIEGGLGDFWMAWWVVDEAEIRFAGVWTKGAWAICQVVAFKDSAGIVPKFVRGPPGAAEAFCKAYGGKVVLDA